MDLLNMLPRERTSATRTWSSWPSMTLNDSAEQPLVRRKIVLVDYNEVLPLGGLAVLQKSTPTIKNEHTALNLSAGRLPIIWVISLGLYQCSHLRTILLHSSLALISQILWQSEKRNFPCVNFSDRTVLNLWVEKSPTYPE